MLADLSAALTHRGEDGEGLWTDGSVGLACRLHRVTPEAIREVQPLVNASGLVLVFDGRLDDQEELLRSLAGDHDVGRDAPDPELVLAAYEAFGERFLERLAGDFALGLFDPRRRRLLLARDAIGIRPLYYYRGPDCFVFASEVKALLAHPQVSTRPDDEFLAGFLLDHLRAGTGRTFFANIASLLPASSAIITPQGFAVRRYWDFDPSRQPRVASFPECVAAFRYHFERAVRRRLRSAYPVAVSVSGGLDSSSIFCLAETLSRRGSAPCPAIFGASYIPPAGSPADERAFLEEIERQYGVAIDRVPVEPIGMLSGAREAVRQVEVPFLDEQWSTAITFLETVQRRGARVLLTGHWGDQVLVEQAYLVDLVRRQAWRQARRHLVEYGRWFTDADPRWFKRRFVLDLVKYSVPATLLPQLQRLRRRPNRAWYGARLTTHAWWRQRPVFAGLTSRSTHARSLYEQARSGHHLLCMEWNNKVGAMHGLDMAFPFLDRDLVTFLMAIPGEMQTWQGVPKALLREAMRGVLPEAIARRTWKADFTGLINENIERDFFRIVDTVLGGVAIRLGYVNGGVVRGDLERIRQGLQSSSAEAAWGLSNLLGLEVWLQVFVGGRRSAAPETASVGGGQG